MILPRENEKDLAEIPKTVLDALAVELVEHVDEVLKIALVTPEGIAAGGSLPLDTAPQAMLVHEDTVVLVGGAFGGIIPMREQASEMSIAPYGSATSRLVEVDVSATRVCER